MRLVLNCVYIWSVHLFLGKDKVPGRNLIRMQYFETWHWSNLLLSGAVDPKQYGARCKSCEAGRPIFFMNDDNSCTNDLELLPHENRESKTLVSSLVKQNKEASQWRVLFFIQFAEAKT